MNTSSISFFERTHFPHTYVIASDKQQSDKSFSPPSLSTQLQHGRLITLEVTQSYFNAKKNLVDQIVRELKKGKVVSQNKMIHVALLVMSKKAIQVALKKLLYNLEQEKVCEYLKECKRKLEDNFQQFYLKAQQLKNSN